MAKLGKLDCPDHAEFPHPGVATWTNPINGFRIVAIHYTSDPDKCTAEWKAKAQQEYPAAFWDQEFEIDFSSWVGRPVYPRFSRRVHVALSTLPWNPRKPMWRGWDIGMHACVWAQLNDERLFVYQSRQIIGAFGPLENRYARHEVSVSGLTNFIKHCQQLSREQFPEAVFKDVIDPSGFNNTITREQRASNVFRECGIVPYAGATNDIDVRVSLVDNWLSWMAKGGQPGILIDPSATVLIDAMAGGYKFDKDGTSPKPVKDGYSHTMDCLQYIASRIEFKPGGDARSRRHEPTVEPRAPIDVVEAKRRERRDHPFGQRSGTWTDW